MYVLSFSRRTDFILVIFLVIQQRMVYRSVHPHEHQQYPLLMQPPYPAQLTFQPLPHGWNNPLPGHFIRPMTTSVPVNRGQTQQQPANPTQVSSVSKEKLQELAASSTLSCDAAPFQPRQPTTHPPNN